MEITAMPWIPVKLAPSCSPAGIGGNIYDDADEKDRACQKRTLGSMSRY
jgi:hypothetical protein